ncbi:hypothetical protein FRC06_009085, partial [Ceratobasidium sp. 370]
MDAERVTEARRRARETGQNVERYLGVTRLCDCQRCYGVVKVKRLHGTIKRHRELYGRAVPVDNRPRAGPSGPQGNALPPALMQPPDADEELDDAEETFDNADETSNNANGMPDDTGDPLPVPQTPPAAPPAAAGLGLGLGL